MRAGTCRPSPQLPGRSPCCTTGKRWLALWRAHTHNPSPAPFPPPPLEQEAYELIMGKRSGKDLEGVPGSRSSWSFHDWCAAAPPCLTRSRGAGLAALPLARMQGG